jgi:DNA repair exonuclease SbcCD nuclease subunit
MKILHVSDTHLGYSAYNRLDAETLINQREQDVYDVFEKFVDHALETKPDLVLHAGDLFDTVRPSNRAIAECLKQLLRLSAAGIPTVLISGNHSTPRLRETGSVFKLLEHIEHIYPIYKSSYERLSIPELPGVEIHGLPHVGTEEQLQQSLDAFAPVDEAKLNIGLIHGAILGVDKFRSFEFNEMMIASGYLKAEFDYIALGHYHEFVEVEPNAYYSGSTERFSFNEVAHKCKGFIELELEKGKRELRFIELPTRPMVDLPPVNCSELGDTGVTETIVERIESVEPAGKILRLRVNNLRVGEYHNIDFGRIRKLTRDAVYYEQPNDVQQDELVFQHGASPRIGRLSEEFSEFLKGYPVEKLDKKRLKKLGLDYISVEEA